MSNFKFSTLTMKMKSSIIRELLKSANLPGVISFGGGVPDPGTFPRDILADIASSVIRDEYQVSLQYGQTEGDPLLRKAYLDMISKEEGISGLTEDNIIITVGSQSALDLASKALLDSDSIYFISKPAYLGAASAFSVRSDFHEYMDLTETGIDVDALAKRLAEIKRDGLIHKVKFVYVVPNFHNPAGVTLSLEKRKRLIELADEYSFGIIEDDPYGDLRFEGDPIPSIFKLAGKEKVLLLRTFSKILSPGMRLGFVIGNESLLKKLALAKQAADLCSPTLTQRIAARFIMNHRFSDHLKPTIALYREKKDLMLNELDKQFSDIPGTTWTRPYGGLFIWLTLPEGFDTLEMMDSAKEKGVLFIPGESFTIDGGCSNSMRLSFCLPPHDRIIEGVRRLRETVQEYGEKKDLL
ncbi:MAG TPA: PLP-dependent aminotransferase family protein [Kosmotogaceae bacterium]|nr:MAG: Putative transcriptional regulator, GntR family [Thermotogales bacterium 46_20]HAA85150.1 PLP-dependent aminotransferase family protein [Kosmotogaceae bacterium]